MAFLLLVFYFRIGKGSLVVGAPVDDAVSLIDQAFVIKTDKHFFHGMGKTFV